MNTLNEIFDLDIRNYATVNFFGMVDIVDAVGGIEATVTQDELTWKGANHPNLNNCMDEICSQLGLDASKYYVKNAGTQTLNGVQAVAYARVRHCRSVWGTNNDYGRTDRQRHVMQGLFNKAVNLSKSQYIKLATALVPCTKTSLGLNEVISLATDLLMDSPSFEQYRIPSTDMTFTGPTGYGSIVYYDLDYAAKLINSVIFDNITMDEYIENHPIEKNNWYKDMTGKFDEGKRPTPNTPTTQTPSTQPPPASKPEEPNDTSSDDVSSDDTPSDDVSIDTSSDDTVSDDVSSDNTSSDETSSDDTSSDNTSSDDTASDDTASENSSTEAA